MCLLFLQFFSCSWFKISKETQKILHSQNNLDKEEQRWRNHGPWLQTYSRATVIKSEWCCHKKTHRSTAVVHSLSRVWLFVTLGNAASRASLSFTISWSLLKLMSQWCHPTISPSVIPFSSCPQSFPASGSFQMSQLFASGGQSIGVSASASALSVNIQNWFPLGLTGLIFFLSKGLSGVFSRTTIWSISSLGLSLLYGPTLTSVHDYWKNHNFNYTDLCQQSDVSAF